MENRGALRLVVRIVSRQPRQRKIVEFRLQVFQRQSEIQDRDIWVFDQYIGGPDSLERARKVLIEKRDACSDPDRVAFLTSIIHELEKGGFALL